MRENVKRENLKQETRRNQKVVHLQPKEAATQGGAGHSKNWKERTLLTLSFLMIILAAWQLFVTVGDSRETQVAYEEAQTENKEAVEHNRLVQEEYQRVQNPDYLADIARRDYYYSKPGEIIFDLESTDSGE